MRITDAHLKEIYAHAKETYPYECCGFLLGTFEAGGLVHEIRTAVNQNQERTDRFIIAPEEFATVQAYADDNGLEIIGIYHSHPDWPAIPSQTDIDSAWEGSYYLITSIHEGRPLNSNIWEIAPSGMRRFVQVPLEIVDAADLPNED